ncbi:MAG: arylsulfatase [Verrucomicrobiales bacterium]|nr:arylsulfatase [Verrucomicrobiales bacterium]
MFRSVLFLSVALLTLASAPLSAGPNVVFILADDLGYGDIESFGSEFCNIDTPHFDQLCADGIKFTDAHVTDSVCIPSRVSIMTGRYALRFNSQNSGGPWAFLGPQFSPDRLTLGDLMKRAGYATGYVGKWHLGTEMTTRNGEVQNAETVDFTRPLKLGPNDYGFDETFILPGSLDMPPYAFIKNGMWKGSVTAEKGWSAFNRLGPAAEDFVDHEVLGEFCREADRFISEQAKEDEPFFLFVGLTAPHTPTSPEPEFLGKSRIGIYGDFVMNADACIGRIRESLRSHGLDDDTLIMVTSDHGPGHYSGRKHEATAFQAEEMHEDGHHANGPWRGYKFSALEGGQRVPFAAVWPGVIAPGRVSDALISTVDLMATLAELTGEAPADNEGPDSISFLGLLEDPEFEGVRESLVARGSRAHSYREGEWKLIVGPGSGSNGLFASRPDSNTAWKNALESYGGKPGGLEDLKVAEFVQLYHLAVDPEESNDLSSREPERLKAMMEALEKVFEAGRSRPGTALPNDAEPELFRAVPKFVW